MIIEDLLKHDETFRYMILGRMQSDCEYFLNTNIKRLWANKPQDQIDTMIALWESFPEDKKPEWLTLEQIKEYGNKII